MSSDTIKLKVKAPISS